MPMNQNSGTTNASKSFWWQKLTLKRASKPTSNTRSITQNWRNLSPDEPPLPFLNSSNNKAISVSANPVPSIKFSEANNHGSELAPISKNHHERPRTYPTAPSSCRDLYTIPEHSEINTTASNSSVNSSVIPTTFPNTMEEESTSSSSQPLAQLNLIRDGDLFVPPLSTISPNTSLSSSSVALTSAISTQPPPSKLNHSIIAEKEEQAEKSTQDYVPITDWPSSIDTTKEPQFKGELEGNEIECKIVFCNMLASAYKYHSYFYHQQPKEMHLIFDDMDNIGGIKFILPNGHREDYLQFGGTPQYIPPELSISAIYNNELADVWALGISLYRMLVGEYPFIEEYQSHLELFRKMLQSDFCIPNTLSEDAKDLLRRMLAPEDTRASFDLIMFHPWIKSHFQPQRSMLQSTPSAAAKPDTNQPKKKKKKKRKAALQAIKKVIRIVFLGPYPPPKRSYYHHNNQV